MLSEELKQRLSPLRKAQGRPSPLSGATAQAESGTPAGLGEWFPEGSVSETARGELFVCEASLREICSDAGPLIRRYRAAFRSAARRAAREALPCYLEPLGSADAEGCALIDTETAGLHGRPLFMIGLARLEGDDVTLGQYFARDYAEEPAVLSHFARVLPELRLLISFNGKAFDWPFVRDRMAYHRLACRASFEHFDLLHPSRRRWRSELPNCKLQTLERYLCGRWRSGDLPGDQIPQRYHDFVRTQDPRLIAPIFHHNRMDLITMMQLVIALVRDGDRTRSPSEGGRRVGDV